MEADDCCREKTKHNKFPSVRHTASFWSAANGFIYHTGWETGVFDHQPRYERHVCSVHWDTQIVSVLHVDRKQLSNIIGPFFIPVQKNVQFLYKEMLTHNLNVPQGLPFIPVVSHVQTSVL